jgi:3-oxoadipate enol-lactonase
VTGGTGRLPAASEPQLAGSCVEVPGGRLSTEQAGAGPAVLFAHAGIADARMWDEQITALAGRYHAIRYDQRGYGRSSPPDVPYSPAADLGAVLDHAGADQAVLVGCSVTGAIAINCALAHPGRVTGLVLAAASTSGLPFEPVPEYFAALRTGDPGQVHATAIRVLAEGRSSPDVDERIQAIIADNVAGQFMMGKNWLDSEPAYPRLGDIAVPTLVVAGDRDNPNFARVAGLLAGRIPGARLEILPGADHLLPMPAAAAFTGLLAGFLNSLQR